MGVLPYSIIMFLGAAGFAALGTAVYRGRTDLIHEYHQTRVQDKAAYGRAFGKALLCFALAMLLSGIVGLFAKTGSMGAAAVAILIIGLCIGVVCMIKVQNKYNKGIF